VQKQCIQFLKDLFHEEFQLLFWRQLHDYCDNRMPIRKENRHVLCTFVLLKTSENNLTINLATFAVEVIHRFTIVSGKRC